MRVVSIDVGIKNLGVCMLDGGVISFWHCFNLGDAKDETNHLKSLKDVLDSKPELTTSIDVVLIEKQPFCNPKMRVISSALHMYFVMKGITKIIQYSPKHKLKLCLEYKKPEGKKETASSKYYSNKKRAIESCRNIISNEEPNWIATFETSKKKDDLADSFLQAKSYIDIGEIRLLRRPTNKQIKEGDLCEGNVRYLFKQWQLKWSMKSDPVPKSKRGPLDMYFAKEEYSPDTLGEFISYILEDSKSGKIKEYIEREYGSVSAMIEKLSI